jgi:hypothetical protein
VTGTVGGTLNYQMTAAVLPQNGQLLVNFTPCIPASARNTNIVVTLSAVGAGGVIAVTAAGYQYPNP